MQNRPENAALFDFAVRECQRAFGTNAPAQYVTVGAAGGLKIRCTVPQGWQPGNTDECAKLANPEAAAEIVHLIVGTGHRMTQTEVIAEIRRTKKRAEGTIRDTLTLLTKLGLLDNRQDVEKVGYGLPSWE